MIKVRKSDSLGTTLNGRFGPGAAILELNPDQASLTGMPRLLACFPGWAETDNIGVAKRRGCT
jgi:hypothetical protein